MYSFSPHNRLIQLLN